MPSFDRAALRKGTAAIDAALESRGNGDFKPFLSNIFWKDDKDYRYLLFLNPIEEVPQVELHPYIDCDDGIPHMTMARTDPSIGERKDAIHDQWNYKPRLTNLAIAVELEPQVQIVNGREKPVGFEVKLNEFERKVRDDEGEDTGEKEEVCAPVVGLVAQSPYNFYNQLRSYDATEAPVHLTALKITRLGKKENVTYNVVGYETLDVDLSGLLEHIENLSYVGKPDELFEAMGDKEGFDACTVIGDYLLYRRIEELADEELYNEILGNITKPAKFGDTKKEGKAKTTRPARSSQRRKADVDEAPSEGDEEPETKTPKVTKASPAAERLARLKEKSKAAKAS